MNSKIFNKLRMFIAICLGFLLAFILISIVSENPLEDMKYFIVGPLRNVRYFGNVIEVMIPLIFSGLAMSILFRANQFNLGAEGVFYFSGLLSAIVVIKLPISSPVLLPLIAMLVGIITGIIFSLIPGILKAKLNADVLVSSLMMNSILAGFGYYILNHTIRDKNITDVASVKFPECGKLPNIIPHTRIHMGLLIALIVVVLVYLFFKFHKWGIIIKLYGDNSTFVKAAGYSSATIILIVHILGGALAGLGGSVEILGMYSRFRWASLPGLGFDGAMVAMMARNKPEHVILSAFFIAYIRTSADIMARLGTVTSEMVFIVQGVMILLISANRFLYHWEQHLLVKKAGV